MRIFYCVSLISALLFSSLLFAQGRTVAITVDDLPYAGGILGLPNGGTEAISAAEMINDRLLTVFKSHHIPVAAFVIQQRVDSLGTSGPKILKKWTTQGFDLGNHTYSHPDINGLSMDQIEQEILRGESIIRPLMEQVGKKPEFFRFPFNHTGETKIKHDAIADFLLQHGYKLATCTIDSSDYLFNDAYVRMLENKDDTAAEKLRREYVAYTSSEIDYYAALSKQVFGYEPPQVMLLHADRLNADMIEQLLQIFEGKHYSFVSLHKAQSDAAYKIPDTYITKFGPMWGYRWAKERNVALNGSLEPEPPKWVIDYGKTSKTSSNQTR